MKKSPKSKLSSRGPQERGLKTYDKLVKAAIELATKSDIGSVRFADISRVANVPPPLISYHFPSPQALQIAMIQHELKKLMELSVSAIEKHQKNPRKALEAYILAPFELSKKDLEFRSVWTGYYHLVTVQEKVAMFNTSVQTTGHERIINLINSIFANEGLLLKKGRSIRQLASSIQGIITGYGFSAATHTSHDFKWWGTLAIADTADLIKMATVHPRSK